MTLSDFRTGHPPIENVGGATSTSAGYPPMTQTTFLTCRAHYPAGSNRCVSVSFPVRAAFPNYLVGRHPRRHFRGLLKLHSRYGLQDCSPAYGGLLSRGSSPASYPTKPLGSYHVLPTSTWVNPPFTGDLRRWGAQVVMGWSAATAARGLTTGKRGRLREDFCHFVLAQRRKVANKQRRHPMKIHTIGIDLGKTSFHLVGLNERGEVVVRT